VESRSRPQTSIKQRKAERELFFWTAFKTLKLILAAAAVMYVVFYMTASLITNEVPGDEFMRLLSGLVRL
jgi:hypothetical protein